MSDAQKPSPSGNATPPVFSDQTFSGQTFSEQTRLIHAGLHPQRYGGVVNPPVMHASTVLADSVADYHARYAAMQRGEPVFVYGRYGTASQAALAEALCELEGGYRTLLCPSGLAACATALTACVKAGDHLLISDSAYGPTRRVGQRLLQRFGVQVQFYDPRIGAGIAALFRPNTRALVLESPGSLTFEMQDIPAMAALARAHGVLSIMDNTWATPLYFKPLAHGVDISVQAAAKYIVGHSDAMVGAITTTREVWEPVRDTHGDLGMHLAPDDAYLAQRGLRSMALRLRQHHQTGVQLAQWLAAQAEVERVLHPALPEDPGHALWRRDFSGASGLFSVVLKPMPASHLALLLDHLELYGIGASWGGYESLVLPFDANEVRSVTRWPYAGPCFRVHAGLEAAEDLIADMAAGFSRLRAA